MTDAYKIDLALQGGGAHGAFTWGVLDRLIDEEDIDINALSGTSAGAMNAAVFLSGYFDGGAAKAKSNLQQFWYGIADLGASYSPFQTSLFESAAETYNLDTNFGYNAFDMLSRLFSPYQLNPLNLNPLRAILENLVDIEKIKADGRKKLFITATNVQSGQARVFTCKDVSIDALLASACIPFLFQAVEIDGEPYWDGGYMGNPVLWPLYYETPVDDVLLVQINPIARAGTPKTAGAIINRLNEITFNASLVAEMRAINFVARLVDEEKLPRDKYRHVRLHRIEMTDADHSLNASSKMNTSRAFFESLHNKGYESADIWLKAHKRSIGKRSTLDIKTAFLDKKPHLPKLKQPKD